MSWVGNMKQFFGTISNFKINLTFGLLGMLSEASSFLLDTSFYWTLVVGWLLFLSFVLFQFRFLFQFFFYFDRWSYFLPFSVNDLERDDNQRDKRFFFGCSKKVCFRWTVNNAQHRLSFELKVIELNWNQRVTIIFNQSLNKQWWRPTFISVFKEHYLLFSDWLFHLILFVECWWIYLKHVLIRA